MNGRRIYPKENEGIAILQPGDYMKAPDGFIVKTPNGLAASIRNHKVIEHENGTITVSPSILITGCNYPHSKEQLTYHGFLEMGIWREV